MATKEQIEDGTWWTTRKIGLALSACVGPFENTGTDKKYWFNYPPGVSCVNVPIDAEDFAKVADPLWKALLLMIAMLGLGFNVAIHGLHNSLLHERSGAPLSFMALLAMLEKGKFRGSLEDEENVDRKSAALLAQIKERASCDGEIYEQPTGLPGSDPLRRRRLELYRHGTAICLPDVLAGRHRRRTFSAKLASMRSWCSPRTLPGKACL